MSFVQHFFQSSLKRWVAVALVLVVFGLTQLPRLSAQEKTAIASRFQFTRLPLPELNDVPIKFVRSVHPDLERHSAWISAVGAAIALNDLDGDGLANDVCYVDPRRDQVIVAPVPGTGDRYAPFQLVAADSSDRASNIAPMGCLPSDLNEDGQTDLLVYYWGRSPLTFLRRSTATLDNLAYQSQAIPSDTQQWYTNAATVADLDGDGHQDLIFGNYFPDNSDILNAQATNPQQMQDSMTRAFNGGTNRVFRWVNSEQAVDQNVDQLPTGQWQEITGIFPSEINQAWTLAIGAADLDGDLKPELYFANDFGPDRLFHNRSTPGKMQFALLEGQKDLTIPNSKVLGHDSFKGMGVDFADLNQDGLLDIYVSNIASEYALEESHFLFASTGKPEQMQQGIAPYRDRSESLGLSRSGWGWETKFGDFDNDGELEALQATGFRKGEINRWAELQELALSNDQMLKLPTSWFRFKEGDDLSGHQHNPFFVKAADGRYYDLAQALNLGDPFVTRGIATADVDGDGDLDFAIANQWEASYFYRNDSPIHSGFLGLKLFTDHHPAIGASVKVQLPDGRQLIAQVDGGNGHSGVRSPDLHFGLGEVDATTLLPVEVQWRDGSGQAHHTSLLFSPGWHNLQLDETTKIASSAF